MGRMPVFPPFSAASLKGKGGHGMMEEGETEDGDSVSSSASGSDSMDEFAPSGSSSPPSQDQPAPPATSSLHYMSSLAQHLPFKRGLSKFYQGKSQSFTSLSEARCLEDLAKPENPYNKKLKSCRSSGGGLTEEVKGIHKSSSPPEPRHPRHMAKKISSKGCCSEMNLNGKSAGAGLLLPDRPPIPPHTSSTSAHRIPSQAPLFA